MTDKTESSKEYPTYWICDGCAQKKGGSPPKWPVTVVMGSCGHCHGKNQTDRFLTPMRDYRWPGETEADQDARWD